MTEKFGWCLTNQHAGDPNVPSYQQCPGQVWDTHCSCECHEKHPPKVKIPPPMSQRPKRKRTIPIPKEQPVAEKPRRQRRKLL